MTDESRSGRSVLAAHRAVAGAAAAAMVLTLGMTTSPMAVADERSVEPVDLVNTFIGTKGDGNTFPGVSMPFGMVQISPDTGHYAGYRWDDQRIRGFSVTHVSGVGCGLAGDQPMLPMTGRPKTTNAADYALPFSREKESAAPGRYEVQLDDPDGAVQVELAATTRTGMQRWTFKPSTESGVMINTGQALHGVTSSSVRVVDDRTIETTVTGSSFCQGTEPYTLHLRTVFDRDITSFQTWEGAKFSNAAKSSGSGRRGVWVGFDTTADRDVVATTAISWVDADGAQRNLEAEAVEGFDETQASGRETWAQWLGRIDVDGGTDEQRRTFYSSLYRTLMGPTRGDDVDGRYRGWDDAVHTTDGFGYYQTSSLWDTYRTQIQLLALIAPKEARDQTISLILQGEQSGWLPKWGYATVETNIMTGDPVTPQIVTAQQFGLLEGWEDRAWEQLRRNADGVPPKGHPAVGRSGNEHYLEHGYVPHQKQPCPQAGDCDFSHGGSATLEYAVADAAMAVFAKSTGHSSAYKRYADRSRNWQNIFTPDTKFPRARDAKGAFVGNPDPAWSSGFHEGTAWQYQWLVPHDLPGLISEIGGEAAANLRLDKFFAYDKLLADPEGTARNTWVNSAYDYYGQQHYNPQNEPDLHAPYVYLWTGQPWKTADVVRAAMTLFRDGPDGITGNDDVGTMSAWHVLSSLGIYPATAGTDQLVIGSPIFEKATVQLGGEPDAGELVINAPGTSHDARYVQSVTLDGKKHTQSWLRGADLSGGAQLDISMGEAPSRWAIKANTRPPAPVPSHGPSKREDLSVSMSTDAPLAAMRGRAREIDASATITVTGRGRIRGTVAVEGSKGITAAAGQTTFSIKGDGTPQVVTIPVRISVAANAPTGDHTVSVSATVKSRTAYDVLQLSVVDPSCSEAGSQCPLLVDEAFDLDGVAPSAGTAGMGNFDGVGWAFAQELLPKPGVHLFGNTAMRIPDTAGTAKNFVRGAASFDVGFRSDKVTLLASAVGGDARDVPFTLVYSDGSRETVAVSVTDWCSGSPNFGERLGIRSAQRVQEGVGLVGPSCSLWLTDIAVNADKELSSLEWQGDPGLRLMALTARRA